MTSIPASTANHGASRPKFHHLLLGWYGKPHRALPWRGTSDPYEALVADAMLQQTQVRRVESGLRTVHHVVSDGLYTAAAVACFGFGLPVAAVDTNVQQVLGRATLGLQPMAPSEAWWRTEQWT